MVTGTAKEVFASSIPYFNLRGTKLLIQLNLRRDPRARAWRENCLGRTRVSYPGNRPDTGRFQAAHEGALLLDEIGGSTLLRRNDQYLF